MQKDLLDALPLALFLLNSELAFVNANPAAEYLLGASERTLAGHPLDAFVNPACGLADLVRKATATHTTIRLDQFQLAGIRTASKSIRLWITPTPSGEVILCADDKGITDALNISATVQAQTALQNHMASVLAHEIKNPLAGIRGAAQLLGRHAAPDDSELTQLIVCETDRINSLLQEIEAFTIPSSSIAREAVNIHEVIRYAQSVIGQSHPGKVVFRDAFDPSLPPVLGHRNSLIQAILNLFKNSIEASDRAANIFIHTSYRSGLRILPGPHRQQRDIPISVTIRDDGPGIPTALREQLFDPFITTKPGGKGLGLAIVSKIIADHEGIIEASSPGTGASFTFYLPVFN